MLATCSRRLCVRAVKVRAGGREVGAVVDSVDSAQRILRGEDVVHAKSAEVIANSLQRIVETLLKFRRSPERWGLARARVDQRRNSHERQSRSRTIGRGTCQLAGQGTGARSLRDKVDAGLVQMLTEALVIAEHESLVLFDRTAERTRRTDCVENQERNRPSKKLRASKALFRRYS